MNLAAVIILALDADFPEEQRNHASRCGSCALLPLGPAGRLCAGWRGTKGGPKQQPLVPAPAPGEGGDPPSFPQARGCRRCCCTCASAASSAGGQMAPTAGPEVELRVTKYFPSLFGKLGQPMRERKVRYHGK